MERKYIKTHKKRDKKLTEQAWLCKHERTLK